MTLLSKTFHIEGGWTVSPIRREDDTSWRCSNARIASLATVREMVKRWHMSWRVKVSPVASWPLTMSDPSLLRTLSKSGGRGGVGMVIIEKSLFLSLKESGRGICITPLFGNNYAPVDRITE